MINDLQIGDILVNIDTIALIKYNIRVGGTSNGVKTLVVKAASDLGSLVVKGNAILEVAAQGTIQGATSLTVERNGTLRLNGGSLSTSSNINVQGNLEVVATSTSSAKSMHFFLLTNIIFFLVYASGAVSMTKDLVIEAQGLLDASSTVTVNAGASIRGAGEFVCSGSLLVAASANAAVSFAAKTTLSGAASISSGNALFSAAVSFTGSATMDVAATAQAQFTAAVAVAGNATFTGSGAVNFTASSTLTVEDGQVTNIQVNKAHHYHSSVSGQGTIAYAANTEATFYATTAFTARIAAHGKVFLQASGDYAVNKYFELRDAAVLTVQQAAARVVVHAGAVLAIAARTAGSTVSTINGAGSISVVAGGSFQASGSAEVQTQYNATSANTTVSGQAGVIVTFKQPTGFSLTAGVVVALGARVVFEKYVQFLDTSLVVADGSSSMVQFQDQVQFYSTGGIRGDGTVEVTASGQLYWYHGDIRSSSASARARTVVRGTIHISSSTARTLQNSVIEIADSGRAFFESSANLLFSGTSEIIVRSSASLSIASSGSWQVSSSGDSGTLTNEGTVTVQSNTNATVLVAWKNVATAKTIVLGALTVAANAYSQVSANAETIIGAAGSASASITVQAKGSIDFGTGALKGSGSIDGSVSVNGVVAPGFSPGTLYVAGDLIMNDGTQLNFEMNGDKDGEYDTIKVVGRVKFGGRMELRLTNNNFNPAIDSSYNLITYTSRLDTTTINQILFSGQYSVGRTLSPTYGSTAFSVRVVRSVNSAAFKILPSIAGLLLTALMMIL